MKNKERQKKQTKLERIDEIQWENDSKRREKDEERQKSKQSRRELTVGIRIRETNTEK